MLKAAVCRGELNLLSLAAFSPPPPDLACLWLLGLFNILFRIPVSPMATSDGLDGCLQRGRSQSDPNILTEPGIDLVHGTGKAVTRHCLHVFTFVWVIFFIFIACAWRAGSVFVMIINITITAAAAMEM